MLINLVQFALAEAAATDCGVRNAQKKVIMQRVFEAFAEDTAKLKAGQKVSIASMGPSSSQDLRASNINKSITQ